jgi:hypothetical protein
LNEIYFLIWFDKQIICLQAIRQRLRDQITVARATHKKTPKAAKRKFRRSSSIHCDRQMIIDKDPVSKQAINFSIINLTDYY